MRISAALAIEPMAQAHPLNGVLDEPLRAVVKRLLDLADACATDAWLQGSNHRHRREIPAFAGATATVCAFETRRLPQRLKYLWDDILQIFWIRRPLRLGFSHLPLANILPSPKPEYGHRLLSASPGGFQVTSRPILESSPRGTFPDITCLGRESKTNGRIPRQPAPERDRENRQSAAV